MTDRVESGTIKITVLDEPFRISSEAEPEYTREVAAHVDRTLRALRGSAPALEPFKAAVLGAMEITDDLFRTRAAEMALAGRIAGIESLVASVLDRAPEWRPGGVGSRAATKRSRKEAGAR